MSIDSGIFPNRLKEAQLTPIFKKNDPSLKGNYRPVSILPIPSTNFEKVLSVQFSDFFDNIFDHFLCAFRKGHGCQTTLLRLLEDWKQALDCKEYIVAILMDLSKQVRKACKGISFRPVLKALSVKILYLTTRFGVWFMAFNATFNNISVILWRSVLYK
jgi:hypothetical protein